MALLVASLSGKAGDPGSLLGGVPVKDVSPVPPGLELRWLGRLELFEGPFLLGRLLGRRAIPSLRREGLGKAFSFKTGRSPPFSSSPS